METGDGLLVRFAPEEPIAPGDFIALCAAARTHGNGTIEITARGSLQVRGLTARSAPAFARAVASLLAPSCAGLTRASILVDPLPDDPDVLIDTIALARELRRAIADARLALAPKVCVILDGGGRLHLDALAADLRLRAIGPAHAPHLHVSVGGDASSATPLGLIPPEAAAATALRVLRVIASHGADARAADVLRSTGVEAFRTACVGATHSASEDARERADASPLQTPPRPPPEPLGTHPLRDGTVALGIALPFGHAHADALAELARLASTLPHAEEHRLVRGDASRSMSVLHPSRRSPGSGPGSLLRTRTGLTLRPAPQRVLLLIGIACNSAETLAARLERLGFIVRADDPRRRIVACPGKGACASGLIAARALAAAIAPSLPPSNDIVHISGCAKGCAHPAPAALTIVGTEHGCGIIERGDARALPSRHVAEADIVAEAARLAEHRVS
jgi:precorrin-3B synthase